MSIQFNSLPRTKHNDTTNQGEELCAEGIHILCEQPALPTRRGSEQQEQDNDTSHNEVCTSALEEKRKAIKASRQRRLAACKSSEVLQGELSVSGMVARVTHEYEY